MNVTAIRKSGNMFTLTVDSTYSGDILLGQKECPAWLPNGKDIWSAKHALKACWQAIHAETAGKVLKRASVGVTANWKSGTLECTATTVHILGEASPAQKAAWLLKYEAASGKRMAKALAMAR